MTSRHLIQGERVFLRPFETGDAELYHRWRADAEVTALAGLPLPLSLAQIEQRIAEKQGDSQYAYVICLLADERPIGEGLLFELDRLNGSAELGIFVGDKDEWGKGYGTDAVNALVDFGFEALRLERIWLEVWTENGRARRAYEKAGFVHEGTLRHDRYEGGQFTDGHVMSLLRDEWLALGRRQSG
ncbi:MAG: GNAT family N-acetyltransferase [Candidatus Limnocylindria bacterium]